MKNLGNYHNFIKLIDCFLNNEWNDFDCSVHDFDWNNILSEFQNHSVVTLAIDCINDIDMPIETKKTWKKEIFIQSSHYLKILHVLDDIAECLYSANIEWSVLKGISAARYYLNPYQRAIGDIDILVSEEDFSAAKEQLALAGFIFGKNIYKYDRHITARKDGIEVELHHFFAQTRSKGNDQLLNDTLFKALPNCNMKKINNISFNSLPELENGIVLIEHIWHHIRTGIGLRQILDFIMYTSEVLDDEFWNNSFKDIAERLDYDILCKAIARIGQLYFGLSDSIKWCKDIDDSIADELLELILNEGDFGIKSTNEFNPTIRVLNKRGDGFWGFLKYEQASGMKNWKAAQNHTLLKPFAWIYGIGRHVAKTLSSKNNCKSLKSNYSQSKKQTDLLKKLKPSK